MHNKTCNNGMRAALKELVLPQARNTGYVSRQSNFAGVTRARLHQAFSLVMSRDVVTVNKNTHVVSAPLARTKDNIFVNDHTTHQLAQRIPAH